MASIESILRAEREKNVGTVITGTEYKTIIANFQVEQKEERCVVEIEESKNIADVREKGKFKLKIEFMGKTEETKGKYRELLKLYDIRLEKLKDTACKISIVKIEDETEIIKKETILNKSEFDLYSKYKKVSETNCSNIISNFRNIIEVCNLKIQELETEGRIVEKDLENLMHIIEFKTPISDSKKIKVFDEFKELREKRRIAKNEKLNLTIILEENEKTIRRLNGNVKHNVEINVDDNHYEKNYSVNYINYLNLKDRDKKIIEAKQTFDVVRDEVYNMRFACYKKVGKNIKKSVMICK